MKESRESVDTDERRVLLVG